MIGIADATSAKRSSVQARGFERHVALVVDGERRARDVGAARASCEDQASAVHYLRFPLRRGCAPRARESGKDARSSCVMDHPVYAARAASRRRRS